MQNTVVGTFNRAPIGIRLDKSDRGALWVVRFWCPAGIAALHISPAWPNVYQDLKHGVQVTWGWWKETR